MRAACCGNLGLGVIMGQGVIARLASSLAWERIVFLPQRGLIPQPTVAAPLRTLGSVDRSSFYPNGVEQSRTVKPRWGIVLRGARFPGCAAVRRPWALEYNRVAVFATSGWMPTSLSIVGNCSARMGPGYETGWSTASTSQ